MSYWGNRKPHFGLRCGIDWGHPLARGMRWCILANEGAGVPQSTAQPTPIQIITAPTWIPNGISGGKLRLLDTTPTAFTIVSRCTIYNWFKALITWTDAGESGSYSHQIKIDASGHIQGYLYDGAVKTATGAAVRVVTGKEILMLALTAQNSNYMRLYLDGTLEAAEVAINTMWTGGTRWVSGGTHNSAAEVLDGSFNYLYIYSRALTADEVAWAYAEPYAMIQAPEMPVFYSIPAGGSSIAAISQYYARMRAA